MGVQLLTFTRSSTLAECKRKHWFRYEIGLVPEEDPDYYRIGSSFHHGQELLGKKMDVQNVIDAIRQRYATLPAWCRSDEKIEKWMVEMVIVCCLLTGYEWRWRTQQLKVVETEQAFRIPITNPHTGGTTPLFEQAGVLDKIITLEDGRTALLEYKTTGDDISVESDWWAQTKMDSQISGYFHGARVAGYPIQTVIYDATRKPGIRPKIIVKGSPRKKAETDDAFKARVYGTMQEILNSQTYYGFNIDDIMFDVVRSPGPMKETHTLYGFRLMREIYQNPDKYFARREVPRLESDLKEFQHELWQNQKILRDCQRGGYWPRNTRACLRWGKCEYWNLCTAGYGPSSIKATAGHAVPSGFTRISNVHPELERKGETDAITTTPTSTGPSPDEQTCDASEDRECGRQEASTETADQRS